MNLHWEVSGHIKIFSGSHMTPFELTVCCYFKLNLSILEPFPDT